jgi:hypothetical protein
MCGWCWKIPEAVMTDVSASCFRSNVSLSQARSSSGILPILENELFGSVCRRMHSRIAWYVAEVNSEYLGLFQRVTRSAILSVGNQLEWLLRAWRISRRWTKQRCSLLSDVVWLVGVKSVRTAAWVICMGELSKWMMLDLRFVSNHREKQLVARMPPLVMLICVMMASVLGHSNRQWCRESCPMLQNGQAV